MLRKIFIFSLAVSLILLIWQTKFASEVVAPIYERVNMAIKNSTDMTSKVNFPENFEKKIFDKLNEIRTNEGKKALIWSDELSKAAKARGVIISTLDDYTGTISGLTREKAYEIVDYDTTHIGDLYLYLITPEDEFIKEITNNKAKSETLLLSEFTEVGISLAGDGEYKEYYILFGNKRPKPSPTAKPTPVQKTSTKVTWGGPELWTAVNNRRVQFGVGQLSRKDELCTIASIRLNQLLDLGKLDGHAGFKPVLDRADLKWISEKYNISEFLAQGYTTPEETVKGWENTLGHRSLLTGGEYVWGCVYSQNSFAVAITAY